MALGPPVAVAVFCNNLGRAGNLGNGSVGELTEMPVLLARREESKAVKMLRVI